MKPAKELFTTGEVARICRMTISTVQKYCESGRIESVKTPVTGHRRIPRRALLDFLRKHGIPTNDDLLTPFKVLIIDDDPGVVKMIERALRSPEGRYSVESTTSAYDGCRLLGSFSPDLVILDVKMPGMDGREMMAVIKRQNEGGTRILVITGYPEYIPEMMKLGADGCLEKPFDPEELLERVREILEVNE